MEISNYTKIFSGNFIVTQLILDRLEAVGISAIIKDESESGRLAGFAGAIPGQQDLYVNLDEADEAKRVVNNVTSEMEAR